ncbi:hypothetical protein [Demequina sp.]|uniref:hypothetical protein n=1 Tax=Demequina sp. TaxID=2050685 RepID=UPI0025F61F49|nr:hypothetical protein [Demequina sp.]
MELTENRQVALLEVAAGRIARLTGRPGAMAWNQTSGRNRRTDGRALGWLEREGLIAVGDVHPDADRWLVVELTGAGWDALRDSVDV